MDQRITDSPRPASQPEFPANGPGQRFPNLCFGFGFADIVLGLCFGLPEIFYLYLIRTQFRESQRFELSAWTGLTSALCVVIAGIILVSRASLLAPAIVLGIALGCAGICGAVGVICLPGTPPDWIALSLALLICILAWCAWIGAQLSMVIAAWKSANGQRPLP
jgi:hypothetical protein